MSVFGFGVVISGRAVTDFLRAENGKQSEEASRRDGSGRRILDRGNSKVRGARQVLGGLTECHGGSLPRDWLSSK